MKTKIISSSCKRHPFGMLLLAGALLVGGCSSNDEATEEAGRTAVRFNAGITSAARTTGGGDQWILNDAVGIFMLKSSGSLSAASDVEASNIKYVVADAATGALTGAPIYYPTGGAAVDFVAYYPYNDAVVADGYKYGISVADQSKPDDIDVLYAKAENKSSASGSVSLAFGHVLSKVTFCVKHGNGFEASDIAGLAGATIEGMPASASMALQDGTLTAGAEGVIRLLKSAEAAEGFDATFSAIVVPQAGVSGRKVVFVIGGSRYEGELPAGDAFEAGNHYTYPVTVNERGVSFGTPSIGKWNANAQNTSEAKDITLHLKVDMDVAFIPAGTFMMGSPLTETGRSSNETLHKVTLTHDFYMGKYEVTNAQYAEFLNANGIGQNGKWNDWDDVYKTEVLIYEYDKYGLVWNSENEKWNPVSGKENFPVVYVTWHGAKAYADWVGGSLPTEAQWEYACRAESTTAYFWGGSSSKLASYAWYYKNSPNSPQEVGTKQPNAWGLYDMCGNVMEWCLDFGGISGYGSADAVDPVGTGGGTSPHVVRGSDFYESSAKKFRSAHRSYNYRTNKNHRMGFRVVFVL